MNSIFLTKTIKSSFLSTLFVALALSACSPKNDLSEKYTIEQDFQLTLEFYPRFFGITNDGVEELIYYADPITRKAVYFKNLNDSLIHQLDISSVYQELEEVFSIDVASIDSIYISSTKKQLLVDRNGNTLAISNLLRLSNRRYQLYSMSELHRPNDMLSSNFFMVDPLHDQKILDSIWEKAGDYEYSRFIYENRLNDYLGARLIKHEGKDSLQMIAKGFYKQFSKEVFDHGEIFSLYALRGDRVLISTAFSEYAYIYSIEKEQITDSVKVSTENDYDLRPIKVLTEENVMELKQPKRTSDFSMVSGICSNVKQTRFCFVLSHGKKHDYKKTIKLFNQDFDQLDQISLNGSDWIFSLLLFSQQKGLLIPKRNETSTTYTFYRFNHSDFQL